MTVNANKCTFAKSEVKFLGHLVNRNGIRPLPEKVEAIAKFERPKLAKELRRFIATINFYRRFIPHAVETQNVLQTLIKGNVKNDNTVLVWTDEAIAAFEAYKSKLAHPSKSAHLALCVDASDFAVGAVLHQSSGNKVQPLGFYS